MNDAAQWHSRQIAYEEASDVAALHRFCFPEDAWSTEDFARILLMAGTYGWLAFDAAGFDGPPQAFLFASLLGQAGEIITIGVTPAARRRGAARALMEELFRRARANGVMAVTLEVAKDNDAAIQLYRTLGFEQIGVRARYYRRKDGSLADAHLLRCIL
jgi:ribosomal-protein-alanine N-acetyltransferase